MNDSSIVRPSHLTIESALSAISGHERESSSPNRSPTLSSHVPNKIRLPEDALTILKTGSGCFGVLPSELMNLEDGSPLSILVELIPYKTDPKFVYYCTTIGPEQITSLRPVRLDWAGNGVVSQGLPQPLLNLLVWTPSTESERASNPWIDRSTHPATWRYSGATVEEPAAA